MKTPSQSPSPDLLVVKESAGSDRAEPLWFKSSVGQNFGWYHAPQGPVVREQGVVLCNTFGSEAMLLHAAYRELAIQLARAGFPCIRFDYPGTGDSSGSPREFNLLAAWLGSIHEAIDLIQAKTDVRQVGLFGAFLGATLATRVAAERSDVSSLVLWAPFLTGRSFLKVAKLQANLLNSNSEKRRSSDWQEGDMEAFGFLLSAEFAEDLMRIDLNELADLPTKRALIFVKDEKSPELKLSNKLKELGSQVDLDPEVLCDVNWILGKQGIPDLLIGRAVTWWDANDCGKASTDDAVSAESAHITPLGAAEDPQRRVVMEDSRGARWQEESIFFGAEAEIFGILSTPELNRNRQDTGIVMVSGGNNSRPGINRNYTEWARGWAAEGFTVLRFDIRGLGDSPPRVAAERNLLYLESTQQDLDDAVNRILLEVGIKRVVLVGLCAGAYQGMRLALNNSQINGLVLLNPLRFHPVDTSPKFTNVYSGYLEDFLETIPASYYLHFLLNVNNWPDLLAWRKMSLRIIRSGLARFVVSTRRLFGMLKSTQNAGSRNSVLEDMLRLTQQNTDVLVVYDTSEKILPYFKVALSPGRTRLGLSGKFTLVEMGAADHIFTPLWSQERVFRIVSEFLEAYRQPAATSAGRNLVS